MDTSRHAGAGRASRILGDMRRLGVTCVLALAAGRLCLSLGVPAPYLMGSLFGVWLAGGVIRPLRAHLGVARWFHVPVILGLGVLIGATFTPRFFGQAHLWAGSVAVMIATTVLVTYIGYVFLRRVRGYEPLLALLCSVPGGQAETLALARETVERDYVVALFHLVRVVLVFVSTPLLLALVQGAVAVEHSNVALETMPGLLDLAPGQILAFVGLGLGGFVAARLARLPMPHLLGPVLASTVCHLAGLLELPRIGEFVILAQVTIGGAIGARLAQVAFGELLGYLRDAFLGAGIILSAYLGVAIGITLFVGSDFLSIWLAFVPGGLYEVTLLALVFGFDVAFVAVHHTVRIMLIFATLPWLALRIGGGRKQGPRTG